MSNKPLNKQDAKREAILIVASLAVYFFMVFVVMPRFSNVGWVIWLGGAIPAIIVGVAIGLKLKKKEH